MQTILRIANPGLIALALLFCSGHAQAGVTDLVGALTGDIGISQEQAEGGTGALFNYAKQNMSGDDFSRLASGLPGLDGLMAKAPSLGGTSEGSASGLSSALGSASSMLGGNGTNELGAAAALAEPFAKLGLDPAMTSKFIGVTLDYVQSTQGQEMMGLLKDALF